MARTRKRLTTHTTLRIHMSDLRRLEIWSPGARYAITITANGVTCTGMVVDYTGAHPTLLHNQQRIEMVQVPSNLGRGMVWYFVCPISGKRCRILYYMRGWRSREAAQPILVYASQSYGRINMYHHLQDTLERANIHRRTDLYMGRTTRRAARLERLQERVDEHWQALEPRLERRMLSLLNLNNLG